MALEMTIDVAEIDELDFRFVAAPRALNELRSGRSSRALTVWAAGLVVIALLGVAGHLLEPAAPVSPLAPARGAAETSPQRPPPRAGIGRGDPFSHSSYRYPDRVPTTITMDIERVPGLDGSVARLAVGGRIAGPVGNIAVELVSGAVTFDTVTRYFAPIGGRPPSPFGAFEIAFRVPGGTALSDLWIVARAYVNGHVVTVASSPVYATWRQSGPDKYVIDDAIVRGPTWSVPDASVVYSIRKAARVDGLGWQVDPYAR